MAAVGNKLAASIVAVLSMICKHLYNSQKNVCIQIQVLCKTTYLCKGVVNTEC